MRRSWPAFERGGGAPPSVGQIDDKSEDVADGARHDGRIKVRVESLDAERCVMMLRVCRCIPIRANRVIS